MRGKLKQPPMPAGSGGVRMRAHLGSLRARLVLYVFCIMIMASLFTSAAYVVMLSAGWLRPLFITQMMSPIWMVCVSSIIGTVITAWIGKYYLSPVTQVIAATKRVAKGDFSVQLPMEDGRGEMGDLVRSFNRMTRELGGIEMFRSDFINSFSHEFKTPIVSIAGFAKLLRHGNLTQEQKTEYLAVIEEESLRLSSMATSVLNLAKVENQTILTGVVSFNLSEQLRSAVLLLAEKWTRKDLNLELDFCEHIICGNEELLKQTWVNLLDNAVKFSEPGGTVCVTIEEAGSDVVVSITNGGSIPEESLTRIFNKFYQVDESHASEGNGIGLAIVQKAVRLHRGEVTARSENGKTTFTVRLPRAQ